MHINLNLTKMSIDLCTWFFLNIKPEEFRKRSFWVILIRGPDLGTFLYELSVKFHQYIESKSKIR